MATHVRGVSNKKGITLSLDLSDEEVRSDLIKAYLEYKGVDCDSFSIPWSYRELGGKCYTGVEVKI